MKTGVGLLLMDLKSKIRKLINHANFKEASVIVITLKDDEYKVYNTVNDDSILSSIFLALSKYYEDEKESITIH